MPVCEQGAAQADSLGRPQKALESGRRGAQRQACALCARWARQQRAAARARRQAGPALRGSGGGPADVAPDGLQLYIGFAP